MSYYTDYHLHTDFSADCDVNMEEMILKSIELKLTELVFTDHVDYDYPGFIFDVDYDKYIDVFNDYKNKYKDEIILKLGIEIGLQPHLLDRKKELINKYPFDFVIASTHVVDKSDPYTGEFFNGKTQYEAYKRYFENILYCINNFKDFNIYGHLDYIIRYGDYDEKKLVYSDYKDILDEILVTLIDNHKGIEVNTSGYKYKLNSPHPHIDVIKRYKELGGEIITVGSDAHSPEYICSNFDKAYEILKSVGFKYITIFNQRKAEFVKI